MRALRRVEKLREAGEEKGPELAEVPRYERFE